MGKGPALKLDELGRKRCPQCKEYKALSEYTRSKKHSFGVSSWCKKCMTDLKFTTYSLAEARAAQLKHTYGLSIEEYNLMLKQQNGVCACCGKPEARRSGRRRRSDTETSSLHVDHCHTTGAVRGLLCSECNQALGLLGEDPDRVKALLKYIEERVLW